MQIAVYQLVAYAKDATGCLTVYHPLHFGEVERSECYLLGFSRSRRAEFHRLRALHQEITPEVSSLQIWWMEIQRTY